MADSRLSSGLSGNLAPDVHKLDCFARNESMEACGARRLPRLSELPAFLQNNHGGLAAKAIIAVT
jgi:hypothetical protein